MPDNDLFKPSTNTEEARAANPDADETVDNEDKDVSFKDAQVPQQDLGNHEDDEDWDPPQVNDEGKLVNSNGDVVFTTVEEALKDGSFLLDGQGRMPGVYLQDLEYEARQRNGARVEQAYENAGKQDSNQLTTRTVSVASSPIPDVTVNSVNREPMTEEDLAPAALRAAPDMPASEEQITRNS